MKKEKEEKVLTVKEVNTESEMSKETETVANDQRSKALEAALKVSFVSVKDIPEDEVIPIRVDLGGNNHDVYITLDKLDIKMIFEQVALKLVQIAKEKAKTERSDQVRVYINGIGDIIFVRNSLVGTVINSNIFLPSVNSYDARCSENDCKGCPYNKICPPGR